MMKFSSRTEIFIFIFSVLAFFPQGEVLAYEGDLLISEAIISKHPLKSRPSGGYFVLENSGDRARFLISVSSDAAERIEMHETIHQDGMMKMVSKDEIEVPAKGKVVFKRGGKHLMIFGINTDGEHLPLVMTFKDGETVTVHAPIKGFKSKKKKASHH